MLRSIPGFLALLVLHSAYAFLLSYFVPKAYLEYYRIYSFSNVQILSVTLFYSIWFAWFINPSICTVRMFIFGVGCYSAGAALVIWARRANPYFAPVLALPPQICRQGPYKYLAHPGYLGFGVMALGMTFILGSSLCYIGLFAYTLLLIFKAAEESDMLRLMEDKE